MRERKWVPGDSREVELQQALTALDELSQQLVAMTSAAGKERLKRQMAAQDARVAELEAAPSESAHWEYPATGETYRKVWEAADIEGMRQLLLRSGITAALKIELEGKRSASNLGKLEFHFKVPSEIKQNLSLSDSDVLSSDRILPIEDWTESILQ